VRVLLRLVALVAAFLLIMASPALAITNGQPDGARHPYVGVAYGVETFCSGTLIAPTVFLTAGHCTEELEAEPTTYVLFDPEPVVDPDLTHPWFVPTGAVTGTPYTHPDYCENCSGGLPGFLGFDVGIIVLDEPVTGVGYGTLPEPLVVSGLTNRSLLTAVGYGVQTFTRGGGQPVPDQYGTRHFADVRFNSADSRTSDMFLRFSTNPAQDKGGACFGDSGGPIFAPDQRTILAVVSFGPTPLCASHGYAQRVDLVAVLGWIDTFV